MLYATLDVTHGQILSQSPTDTTLVAFVWESTQETINLPLSCLQGGVVILSVPNQFHRTYVTVVLVARKELACFQKARFKFTANYSFLGFTHLQPQWDGVNDARSYRVRPPPHGCQGGSKTLKPHM